MTTKHFLPLLLFFYPLLAPAQVCLGVYTGANFPGSSIPYGDFGQNEKLQRHYHPGINLGFNAAFPLQPHLEVTPLFEYNHYIFKGVPLAEQENPPFIKEAAGKVSRAYRIAFEVRFFHAWASRNRIYLSTGVGVTVEKPGAMTFVNSDGFSWTYRGESKRWFAHSLGIGYQHVLSSRLALDLCAKYYSTYIDWHDVSTNIGIVYTMESGH